MKDITKISKKRILEVLREGKGNISRASDILEVKFKDLYDLVVRDDELKYAIKEANDRMVASCLDILDHAIENQHVPTAFKILETLGRDRGFGKPEEEMFNVTSIEDSILIDEAVSSMEAKLKKAIKEPNNASNVKQSEIPKPSEADIKLNP